MFSYVNMYNYILNFWHLILYFPLQIHMEKLSLKITYYFITHIATEYESNPTTWPCLYQKPLTVGFPLRCLLPERISLLNQFHYLAFHRHFYPLFQDQYLKQAKMMMGGGGEVEGMGLGVMAALPLQLTPTVAISSGDHLGGSNNSSLLTNNGSGGLNNNLKKDDRIPQWGFNETKEFIAIRAELEKDFTQTKRNKTLWELISSRMKEKGFRRSSEQCKCKWKNLVNRYKVCFGFC